MTRNGDNTVGESQLRIQPKTGIQLMTPVSSGLCLCATLCMENLVVVPGSMTGGGNCIGGINRVDCISLLPSGPPRIPTFRVLGIKLYISTNICKLPVYGEPWQ